MTLKLIKKNHHFFLLASGDDEQTDNNKAGKNSQADLRQRSRSQSDFRQTPKEITAKPERIPTGSKRKALNPQSGKYSRKLKFRTICLVKS